VFTGVTLGVHVLHARIRQHDGNWCLRMPRLDWRGRPRARPEGYAADGLQLTLLARSDSPEYGSMPLNTVSMPLPALTDTAENARGVDRECDLHVPKHRVAPPG
jgi:hypothetical protein